MPTPLMFQAGTVDPFRDVAKEDRNTDVTVFYATDRLRRDISNPDPDFPIGPDQGYTAGRAERLALGSCTVTLGDDHDWRSLCHQASLPPYERDDMPLNISDTQELGALWMTISPVNCPRCFSTGLETSFGALSSG